MPARQSDIQEAAIAGLAPGPSLETIVREAHRQGYSDVHLGVGEGPRFRCRGDIQRTEWPTTDGKRAAFHDILLNSDACQDYIQRG